MARLNINKQFQLTKHLLWNNLTEFENCSHYRSHSRFMACQQPRTIIRQVRESRMETTEKIWSTIEFIQKLLSALHFTTFVFPNHRSQFVCLVQVAFSNTAMPAHIQYEEKEIEKRIRFPNWNDLTTFASWFFLQMLNVLKFRSITLLPLLWLCHIHDAISS